MLVLSRKKEQEIRLPEIDVTFQVLEIRGNTVRIGVRAPRDVKVMRGELLTQQHKLEFDFAEREREADAEYLQPGYVWPLGVSYVPRKELAKCA
jgi:carbon storage regulator CsrA